MTVYTWKGSRNLLCVKYYSAVLPMGRFNKKPNGIKQGKYAKQTQIQAKRKSHKTGKEEKADGKRQIQEVSKMGQSKGKNQGGEGKGLMSQCQKIAHFLDLPQVQYICCCKEGECDCWKCLLGTQSQRLVWKKQGCLPKPQCSQKTYCSTWEKCSCTSLMLQVWQLHQCLSVAWWNSLCTLQKEAGYICTLWGASTWNASSSVN